MIHVGVDLHQRFCYVTVVDASGKILQQRAIANDDAVLRQWARSLPGPAQVVMEACSFWPAFRKSLAGEVQRMVLVYPARVKAIASAKLKNDRVDSMTLAHLSRCDLLPEAWKSRPGRARDHALQFDGVALGHDSGLAWRHAKFARHPGLVRGAPTTQAATGGAGGASA